MAVFKNAFTKSCELSSMIPLPRIVKAKSKCQRLLWTFALITGLAFGSYQFIELVILYFRYPTSVDIKEISDSPPFPDVTICHLDFDWSIQELQTAFQDEVVSIPEYENRVQQIIDSLEPGSKEYNYSVIMKSSVKVYLQNIQKYEEQKLASILRDQFIIGCSSVNITDMTTIDCFRDGTYKVFMDPLFGMCITFTDIKLMSLNIILLLSNSAESQMQEMDLSTPQEIYPSKSGARVVIHPHKSFPDLNYFSHYVLPGAEYDFDVVGKERVSLPEPYGVCANEGNSLQEEKSTHAAYRHGFGCYRFCTKRAILEECGCLFYYYAQDEHNRTLCTKIEGNVSQIVDRIDCAFQVANGMGRDFKSKCDCLKPCKEFEYEHKVHENPWPHFTYHLSFYEKYIRQSPVEDKFKVYEQISNLKQENETLALEEVEKLDLIEKNFAYVRILNHQWKYLRYSETPLLSMESIIGSIGGLFNLWAGISFFTFIEMLEFFFKWLPHYWLKDNSRHKQRPESLV